MQFNFIGSLPLNSVVNQLQAGAARRGKSPLRRKEPGALSGGERLRADDSIFSEQRVPQTLIAAFRCAAVQATSASLSLQSVATPAINIRRTRTACGQSVVRERRRSQRLAPLRNGERYVQFCEVSSGPITIHPTTNIVKSPMFENAGFANGVGLLPLTGRKHPSQDSIAKDEVVDDRHQ
jgi:hypothetical protein